MYQVVSQSSGVIIMLSAMVVFISRKQNHPPNLVLPSIVAIGVKIGYRLRKRSRMVIGLE